MSLVRAMWNVFVSDTFTSGTSNSLANSSTVGQTSFLILMVDPRENKTTFLRLRLSTRSGLSSSSTSSFLKSSGVMFLGFPIAIITRFDLNILTPPQ